jgi:hypothetical protein
VVWLAFSALASHLSLSFGHVHLGQFSGGPAAWAAVERGNPLADVAPSPPQKNPTGFGGDFCAICANISLANTLVLPILGIILAPCLFAEIPLKIGKLKATVRRLIITGQANSVSEMVITTKICKNSKCGKSFEPTGRQNYCCVKGRKAAADNYETQQYNSSADRPWIKLGSRSVPRSGGLGP